MLTDNQITAMLHDAKVRPSVHRMAVLKYVANGKTHPMADEIFNAIAEETPTVSRTTIYNALHTLVEAGLLRELEIESLSVRYDLARQLPHSHFKCKHCSRIFDMALPDGLEKIIAPGFSMESADVYFSGVCPDCRK